MNSTNNFKFRAQSVCRKAKRRHSITVCNHFDVLGGLQGDFTRVFKILDDSNRLPAAQYTEFINDV